MTLLRRIGNKSRIAKEYKLFITELSERQSLKNRSVEIILTNYDVKKKRGD
jgi:hypothetical protein